MVNLYFYTKDLLQKNENASGSAPMRSIQICKNIQKRFKFIECIMTLQVKNVKNSAILFVKDNFDLTLDILGPVGDVVSEWVIKGAYVKTATFGEYDWSTDAAINLDITIAMDYCILNF